MNQLSRERQLLMLRAMCLGNGVRATALLAKCDTGTVLKYLLRFGIALRALHHEQVVRISLTRLEIDEVWAFVYGKTRNKRKFSDKAPDFAGDYFTWTAIDPDSKLLVSYYVSHRTLRHGLWFLSDVRYRVRGEPLITTDGLSLYRRAVRYVFPHSFHVVIEKETKSHWNRETGDREVMVIFKGKRSNRPHAPIELASTSHNERHNATIRNFLSRFTRYSYAFSKNIDNHIYAHAIYAAYYNFAKEHRSLPYSTPAMAAGIADQPWSFDDLLAAVDDFWRGRASKPFGTRGPSPPPDALAPLAQGQPSPAHSFFVCNDTIANKAKVHAGSCRNCQFGVGRGGSGKTNRWYAFDTQAAAEAAADELAPDHASVCSICVRGFYRIRRC